MLRWLVGISIVMSGAAAQAQARLVGDLPRKDAKALVELPGLETEYGQIRTTEGFRLRSILTRPTGTTSRLPAILLTQWVSCGSLDFAGDRQSQLRQIADR